MMNTALLKNLETCPALKCKRICLLQSRSYESRKRPSPNDHELISVCRDRARNADGGCCGSGEGCGDSAITVRIDQVPVARRTREGAVTGMVRVPVV